MFFEIFDIKNIKHVINSDKIIQINYRIGNFLIVLDSSESIVVPKNAYNYLDEILKIKKGV